MLEKFRFALKLMAKQLDDAKLQVVNDRKQNLLHVLAAKTSTTNKDLQNAVSNGLLYVFMVIYFYWHPFSLVCTKPVT